MYQIDPFHYHLIFITHNRRTLRITEIIEIAMMSSLRDPPATMGSESWKNQSLKILTLAQKVAESSARNCDIGRSVDTEPQIRDTLVTLSNDEIRRYMREVRVVVAKVRESLIETNEEIKALTRGKEALERTLEHTRKDIQLNKDSKLLRQARPSTEKVRGDKKKVVVSYGGQCLNIV